MTNRQADVVAALKRVYGDNNVIVRGSKPKTDTFVHAMVSNSKGNVIISTDIPEVQNPDRPDVGDRVMFIDNDGQRAYGLIVVYRDMDDSIGIVPNGLRSLVWEHIRTVEIVANGD